MPGINFLIYEIHWNRMREFIILKMFNTSSQGLERAGMKLLQKNHRLAVPCKTQLHSDFCWHKYQNMKHISMADLGWWFFSFFCNNTIDLHWLPQKFYVACKSSWFHIVTPGFCFSLFKKNFILYWDVTLIIKLSIKTPLQEYESHYTNKISVTEIVWVK